MSDSRQNRARLGAPLLRDIRFRAEFGAGEVGSVLAAVHLQAYADRRALLQYVDYLIAERDAHLNNEVAGIYPAQPLAQDWARVAKAAEELGEVIGNLILYTGQNPRKRQRRDTATLDDLLGELADTAITAMLGMTHFTKNRALTLDIIEAKLAATHRRIATYAEARHE